jgi:hypothetical protein
VELPFRLIFEAPTVASFAMAAEEVRVSQQSEVTAPVIVPISRDKYRVSKAPSQVSFSNTEAGTENENGEGLVMAYNDDEGHAR